MFSEFVHFRYWLGQGYHGRVLAGNPMKRTWKGWSPATSSARLSHHCLPKCAQMTSSEVP